jgi:hypothetical protein
LKSPTKGAGVGGGRTLLLSVPSFNQTRMAAFVNLRTLSVLPVNCNSFDENVEESESVIETVEDKNEDEEDANKSNESSSDEQEEMEM